MHTITYTYNGRMHTIKYIYNGRMHTITYTYNEILYHRFMLVVSIIAWVCLCGRVVMVAASLRRGSSSPEAGKLKSGFRPQLVGK